MIKYHLYYNKSTHTFAPKLNKKVYAMKNKLFYFIGVACLLSYTGTFTSCVNGVDDEYLEQKITDEGGSSDEEGEELPDLNGDYSIEGDYELVMTCNGEPLDGKKVVMAVDETNEFATITFAAAETDLESVIGLIPGANLINDMGLKYTGNSPVPGEKEITITNVPLFRNGTDYIFKGELIQPTYSMAYEGKIEGEKMTVDINYELTNQKLVGTWNLAPANTNGMFEGINCVTTSPLWIDWASNVIVDPGEIEGLSGLRQSPNGIFTYLLVILDDPAMAGYLPISLPIQRWITNLLKSVTAKPNGSMYAIYSYSGDLENPQWSSPDGMPHNALRYYYDVEKPDERIYLELNSGLLIDIIKGFIPASPTRADIDYGNTKEIGKQLIKLIVPLLEKGIPCDYKLEGNKMTLNIDGVVLRDILAKLVELANDPAATTVINDFLDSQELGAYKENITLLLSTLPNALKYKDLDERTGIGTGVCDYVKLGFKLIKE